MKDIMFDDITMNFIDEIESISAVEKSYDCYEVTVWTKDDELYRVLDTRNSRCSDLVYTDSQHEKNHARWLIRRLGGNPDEVMIERFNHNPACWDDDCGYGDEVDYIGDGLDTYFY